MLVYEMKFSGKLGKKRFDKNIRTKYQIKKRNNIVNIHISSNMSLMAKLDEFHNVNI